MILLGICTSLKTDLRCTTTELVYGTTLRLPGQFFNTSTDITTTDPSDYVSKLMYRLKATPPRQPFYKNSAVSSALSNCIHVFIHHDAVKKPLQQQYDGPFQVISRKDKHFTVEVKGKKEVVSIDHLKPAFLDSSSLLQPDVSITPVSSLWLFQIVLPA